MAPKFPESVATALQQAFEEAETKQHSEVTESHLLRALFSDPQGYFQTLVSSCNLNSKELLDKIEEQLKRVPSFEEKGQQPSLSPYLQTCIQEAQTVAKKWNDNYIASDHLFLSFWQK